MSKEQKLWNPISDRGESQTYGIYKQWLDRKHCRPQDYKWLHLSTRNQGHIVVIKKQATIALSLTEIEYVPATSAISEAVWVKKFSMIYNRQ